MLARAQARAQRRPRGAQSRQHSLWTGRSPEREVGDGEGAGLRLSALPHECPLPHLLSRARRRRSPNPRARLPHLWRVSGARWTCSQIRRRRSRSDGLRWILAVGGGARAQSRLWCSTGCSLLALLQLKKTVWGRGAGCQSGREALLEGDADGGADEGGEEGGVGGGLWRSSPRCMRLRMKWRARKRSTTLPRRSQKSQSRPKLLLRSTFRRKVRTKPPTEVRLQIWTRSRQQFPTQLRKATHQETRTLVRRLPRPPLWRTRFSW